MNTRPTKIDDVSPRPDADVDAIKSALAVADPNVLRLVLYHLTGDPDLASLPVEVTPVWAGALSTYSLATEHHEAMRQRALEYFLAHDPDNFDEAALMDSARIRRTMELFGHGPLTEDEFLLGYEEAGFEPFPREVRWNKQPPQSQVDQLHVAVIGAGISGISAAVHLEQLGLPYTVIERQGDIGGTWNLNNYPEARVDSSSLIYQYKFEKRYPWTEFFAAAAETKAYLKHCAEKFNIAGKVRFNTELRSAIWNEAVSQWDLTLIGDDGREQQLRANFVIAASGLFSTPKLPDIPGIGSFEGTIRHTTNWDPDYQLGGRRAALIGTGASGAQLMPYLARHAEHLDVFQRTANWVLPMEGYRDKIPAQMQWLFDHYPLFWYWHSYAMHYLNAQLEGLQEFDPEWLEKGGVINQRNDELHKNVAAFIEQRLADRPDLVKKVMPRYPPLARRPTVDNGWYDALLRDNVELVTDPIDHITRDAIVAKDGTTYPCDLIVCAVGFSTMSYMWPVEYVGRDGATFAALWRPDGPRAYMGMTAPGFPNFFMFYGPNAQARAGSFYSASECWSRYALKLMVHTIESGGSSVECRPQAFADYNDRLAEANKQVIWEAFGKGFYYLTEQGRSVTNAPWRGSTYFAMLRDPDFDAYTVR